MTDLIGWASSLILLATIGFQVRKQWVEPPGRTVSKWLFIGQTAASLGFTIYSALLENWVFTVTNSLLLLSAIAGIVITVSRRRAAAKQNTPVADEPGAHSAY